MRNSAILRGLAWNPVRRLSYSLGAACLALVACGDDTSSQGSDPLVEMQGLYDMVESDGNPVCTMADTEFCGGDWNCWFDRCPNQSAVITLQISTSYPEFVHKRYGGYSGELQESYSCSLTVDEPNQMFRVSNGGDCHSHTSRYTFGGDRLTFLDAYSAVFERR